MTHPLLSDEQVRERFDAFSKALTIIDWEQHRLHGGEPCFHLGDDGWFCGRAARWDGHFVLGRDHAFVPLYEAVQTFSRLGAQIERERCAKVCEEVYKPGDWFDGVTNCRHCAAAIRSQP